MYNKKSQTLKKVRMFLDQDDESFFEEIKFYFCGLQKFGKSYAKNERRRSNEISEPEFGNLLLVEIFNEKSKKSSNDYWLCMVSYISL